MRDACVDLFFFFFNDTATTEIYTLSLHDALPIWQIPGNNSNSNGFSSCITSIQWNKDPTNSNPPDLPNVSSLNGSTNYTWQIQASDVNGNSAQVQGSFETLETQLSLLPAGGA